MIEFSSNEAIKLLREMRPSEDRMKSWMDILNQMFELEKEQLITLIQDQQRAQMPETNLDRADVIDVLVENLNLSRANVKKYEKPIQELLERLKKPERIYLQLINAVKESLDDGYVYYGRAKDGSQVWNKLTPKK